MGGWGVSAQSILIPLEYPQSFPRSSSVEPRFQQVGQDVGVGIKGTMFVSRKYRASVNPYYHRGFNESNYRAFGLNFELIKLLYEKEMSGVLWSGCRYADIRFERRRYLTGTQLYAKGQLARYTLIAPKPMRSRCIQHLERPAENVSPWMRQCLRTMDCWVEMINSKVLSTIQRSVFRELYIEETFVKRCKTQRTKGKMERRERRGNSADKAVVSVPQAKNQ